MNKHIHFTNRITSILAFVALSVFILMPGRGWGQINEHFSTWATKNSYTGALSQSGSGGTWTALSGAVIVSPTGVPSGTGSTGYVQIASSNILTLPNIASGGVGTVTLQARFSGSNGSFTIEKNVNGGGWNTVQTFPSSATTAIQFQAAVNDASANIQLRISNSAARTLYIYDVATTTYSATPSLSSALLSTALTTIYGTAPATYSVFATVSGSNLGTNIVTATAQAGYEVSLNGTSGWGSSVTYTPSSGSVNSPVYVRFAATKAAGSYNSATCVVLSCSGVTDANVSTTASGNIVSPAVPVVNVTNVGTYTYNGSSQGPNTASNTGTGSSYTYSYVGVSGTSYSASATAPTNAGSYTVTATVAADGNFASASSTATAFSIDKVALTITGITANDKTFDGTTTATLSGTPAYSGLVNGETFEVTGTPVATFADAAVGDNKTVTVNGYTPPSANYTVLPTILTANITAASTPIISATGTLTALSTTYGTASSATSFSVVGSSLTADIIVTPPAGFEVSQTSGGASGYAATQTLTQSGGNVASTTVYVRLKATATVDGSPYSGNIVLTSTDATDVNVATVSSTVSPYTLTVSGLSGVNKTYDATNAATLTGTATLSATVNSDVITLNGTPTGAFIAGAGVGNSKSITISGLSISGTNSSSYSLTAPTASANITAKALTMSGLSVPASKTYDGNTTAVVGGTPVLNDAEDPGTGTTSDGIPYTGDAVSITGTATGTYNDPNVASANTVTFGGLSLTGAQSGNYTLTIQSPQPATITKANQTITFNALPAKTTTDGDFAPGATSATSGTNPITYTSSNTAVATIVSGNIHIVGAGTSSIKASQAESANYNAAVDVTQTLTVSLAPIALGNYPFTGTSCSVAAYTPAGVNSKITFSNISTTGISCNNNVPSVFSGSSSWGTAFSSTKYVEFTVTPNSGYLLTANSVVIDVWRSTNGATNYAIRSSVDNYATDLITGAVVTSSSTKTLTLNSSFIGLSSALTFRIYGWGGSSSGDFRIDNIKLNGNLDCSIPSTPMLAVTQPSCLTQSGTIVVTAPIAPGMTYSIDGADYTNINGIFGALAPNTYSITAKNACGNISSPSLVTIDALPTLPGAPSATIVSPTSCGETTGRITIASQSNVTYSIDGTNYQESNVFSNVPPGTYTIYVKSTSAGECVASTTDQVVNAAPTVPSAPTATLVSPSCGETAGSITIDTQSDVTYSINGTDYQAENAFSNVLPGTYTIYVKSTSAGECVASTGSQVINAAPAVPSVPTATIVSPTACGETTGSITIDTQSDVTYSINGTDYQAGNAFSNVLPGTYTIYVKSISTGNCVASTVGQVVTSAPAIPAAPEVSVTDPTCLSANGSVAITSGTSDLTFSTNGIDYAPYTAAFVVAAGADYSITAKNASGCVSEATTGTMGSQPASPAADAGPDYFITLTGVPYSFPGATASGGTISWSIKNTIGAGGAFSPELPANGVLHPVFTPSGTGFTTITLTVTGSCDIVSNDITIYVMGTDPVEWNGAQSTRWNNPNNWSQFMVPDATTNVLIKAEAARYPTLIADAYCKDITIEAGASLIDSGNYLHVNGTATLNHAAVSAGQWHLISSPVVGAVSGMFAGQYLRNYDPATGYKEITTLDVTLNEMEGYALWPVTDPNAAPYVSSTGTGFNSGDISKNLYTSSTFGWNLVGNPYPSTIDWKAPSGWTKTNVAGAIYIENGANWASYNVTGVNGGSRYIAPAQGFFVKAAPGTTATLAMTPAVQLHMQKNAMKSSEEAVPNLVRLEVSGNGYKDEAVVHFVAEATNEFDNDWDAYKFFGKVPEAAQLYTLGSIALSINSLPTVDVVPVGIHIGKEGNYTIAATEMNDLANVTLEDMQTGIFTDLSTGSYTFNALNGVFDQRFKLHFSMLSVEEAQKATAEVYSYQRTIYINIKDQQKGDIFVYNISGQLVKTIPSARGNNEIKVPVTGNYIVKVVGRDNTSVKKVWIQQ